MVPPVLRAYLLRTVLQDPDTGNSVTVVQASEPSADSSHIEILLDVDAFMDVDWAPDDPRITERLGSLRELKNRGFFGSLTERSAEMYE